MKALIQGNMDPILDQCLQQFLGYSYTIYEILLNYPCVPNPFTSCVIKPASVLKLPLDGGRGAWFLQESVRKISCHNPVFNSTTVFIV